METIAAIKPWEAFRSGLLLGIVFIGTTVISNWLMPREEVMIFCGVLTGCFFGWVDPSCRRLLKLAGQPGVSNHFRWCVNVLFLLLGIIVAYAIFIPMWIGTSNLFLSLQA
jgi:hypothetical protein